MGSPHIYVDLGMGSPNLYRFGDGGSLKSGVPISMTQSLYRAFSCDVVTFEITKENRKQLPCSCRSFYGNLHQMSDILIMLLICVESDKIPLLHKLKQLYKRLPVGFLIDIAYTANNILYKLHQDGGLFLVYGICSRDGNAL